MKKALNLAVRLLLICAVASAALAFTNSQTQPIIEARKAEEFVKAFGEVYPGGENYVAVEDASLLNEQITQIIKVEAGGSTVGYVIEAIGNGGYAGPVKFMVGVANNGEVKGFKITESAESPGFGKKAEEPAYTASVVGTMFNAPVIANGDGAGENEVMMIGGATLTSNALVNGFDAVIQKMSELSDEIGPIDPNAKPEPTVAPAKEVDPAVLVTAVPGADAAVKKEDAMTNDIVKAVFDAQAGGSSVGMIYQVEPKGFGGNFVALIGLDEAGKILGFKAVEHGETEGYGAAMAEDSFAQSLVGKNISDQLDGISGATITSDALASAYKAIQEVMGKTGEPAGTPSTPAEPTVKEPKAVDAAVLVEAVPGADAAVKKEDAKTNDVVTAVFDAQAGGATKGTIYQVQPKGFAGEFVALIGLDEAGKILGFKVVEHNETDGYGAAMAEAKFAEGLVGKNIADKIDGISGATGTSDALESAYKAIQEVMGQTGTTGSSETPAAGNDGQSSVYPDAKTIEKLDAATLPEGAINGAVKEVSAAKSDADEVIGYVFKVETPEGFHDPIEYEIGVDKEGNVTGLKVTKHDETPGFGAVIEEDSYVQKVVGKKIDTELEAISGATFTSKAMQAGYTDVAASLAVLKTGGTN